MKYNIKNQEKIYEYAIKEMVGHSIKDITESVYTVRDLEWLRNDLKKLTYCATSNRLCENL